MIILAPTTLEAINAKTGVVYQLVPIVNAYRIDDLDLALNEANPLTGQVVKLCRDFWIRCFILGSEYQSCDSLDSAIAHNWLMEGCEMWESGRAYTFLIMSEGTLYGALCIQEGEIRYALSSAASGVMSPSVCALITFVQQIYPNLTFFANVHKTNKASEQVLERCGFVRCLTITKVWPFAWRRFKLAPKSAR